MVKPELMHHALDSGRATPDQYGARRCGSDAAEGAAAAGYGDVTIGVGGGRYDGATGAAAAAKGDVTTGGPPIG